MYLLSVRLSIRAVSAVMGFVVVASFAVGSVWAQTPTQSLPKFGVLVDAPGVAVTYGFCTVCHSEKIIAQQGLPREEWNELLDWMTEEHGMATLVDPLRTQILDYLSVNYGVDRPNYLGDGVRAVKSSSSP